MKENSNHDPKARHVISIIIFALMLFPAQLSRAQQWQTSGSNLYNLNTGNVGIGTTNPGTKLHINIGTNQNLGIRSYNNLTTIQAFNDGGASIVPLQLRGSSISLVGGNVGIGTTNPTSKMSIQTASGWDTLNFGADGGQSYVAMNAKQTSGTWSVVDSAYHGVKYESQIGGSDAGTYHKFDFVDKTSGTESTAMVIKKAGNVGIGTTTPDSSYLLHVAGNVRVDGNLAAKYQDLAEWVSSAEHIEPGTVVITDPEREDHVLASSCAYDTRVAGVVSYSPGIVLGEAGEGKVKVATTGRVRVRVDASIAPIRIGDLLVTSSESGAAMRSDPIEISGHKFHKPGTILGKALQALDSGTGEVIVLLSLQ
jgi:hypothetical protein